MTDQTKQKPEPWEERWAAGRTGWDQGRPHTALLKLLGSDRSDQVGVPKKGKALVPGCGFGYDVLLFAQRGLYAEGLDISPTGAQAARKWLRDNTENEPSLRERTKVTHVNFFDHVQEGGYDLIYDYTFLCALDPSLRPAWAKQMTALSRPSPSTRLITLMYPLNGGPGGPPYSLTEEVYHKLLNPEWEVIWEEEIPEGERRKDAPPGGEKLAVWRRRI